MSKNIVIFSDGTGQKGGEHNNTNIYRMFNMLENRTDQQVVFYDPGLGTDWRRVTGNIWGSGISRNILDCYTFLFENYQAGDRIFLFGFSRGAATVRSLTGFVHMFGILPQARKDLIRKAFRIYKIQNQELRLKKAEELIELNNTMWCKIKFLGVYDTVAAIGVPIPLIGSLLDYFFPTKFHNFKLSESVEFARQALAIDEQRKLFSPLLWDALKEGDNPDRLKQVWFAGVHTDVGGGYKVDDLANIPLKWMLREAKEKGLLIYEPSPAAIKLASVPFNPNGIMHNELDGWMGYFLKAEQRNWNADTHGVPVIHSSVFERTKNAKNTDSPGYEPWILKTGQWYKEE